MKLIFGAQKRRVARIGRDRIGATSKAEEIDGGLIKKFPWWLKPHEWSMDGNEKPHMDDKSIYKDGDTNLQAYREEHSR